MCGLRMEVGDLHLFGALPLGLCFFFFFKKCHHISVYLMRREQSGQWLPRQMEDSVTLKEMDKKCMMKAYFTILISEFIGGQRHAIIFMINKSLVSVAHYYYHKQLVLKLCTAFHGR